MRTITAHSVINAISCMPPPQCRRRSLIAANVRPQASTSMSWVYCRKMMDKCDRGDQLACELFDRYCGG